MPSTDKRVVEMQFDNKQFESGVHTTLESLKKLKDGLNFKGSAKSLEEINEAGKKVNLSGIGRGVESIASKFNALGVIGFTVLQNLTNSAMTAGKQITNALTIKPIKMGFQEYETQINAVQTILANTSSKGTTLKQVNDALDELNKYADMTIYNFTEMTRNIGTFTAAGVDLDTSVSAIKGIANLAAVSGSTSQQASTAMYQLSQALAAGTVKLMDWNSVVNAGMGGQVFQDALKETARVHGIAIDDMIAKEGSFRETLQKGWLTSEILTETLAKFTGDLTAEQLKAIGYNDQQIEQIIKMGQTANDAATKVKTFTQLFDTLNEALQSGWTQSWEYIIGDFEEAKESLTRLSDIFSNMINDSAEARNAVLKEWSELGGRQDLFDGVLAGIEAVGSYLKPVKEGFKEIIPPVTGQALYELTKGFKEFVQSLKLSDEQGERVKQVVKNLVSPLKVVIDTLAGSKDAFGNFVGGLSAIPKGIFTIVEALSQMIAKFTEGINLSGILSAALNGLGAVFSFVGNGLSNFGNIVSFVFNGISTLITKAIAKVTDLISLFGQKTREAGEIASQGLPEEVTSSLGTVLTNIKEMFIDVVSKLPDIFKNIVSTIVSTINMVFRSLDYGALGGAVWTGILFYVMKFVKGLSKAKEETGGIMDGLKGIADSFCEVLDGVKETLSAFVMSIRVNMLVKIAVALGILAASLVAISNIPPDQLITSLGILVTGIAAISGILVGVLAAMKKFSENIKGFKKLNKMSVILRSVATSILIFSAAVMILAIAVEKLSKLSWKELVKGLAAIAVISGILVGVTKLMTKTKGLQRTAVALAILGVSIRILVESIEALGSMSVKELAKGLIGLAAAFRIIIAAIKVFDKVGSTSIKSAAGIVVMAIAMKVMAGAIEKFGKLSLKELAKGLIGLVVALRVLVGAIDALPDKGVVSRAASIMIMAAGLSVLANVINKLGSMSIKELAKGLGALVISLNLLVSAMRAMEGINPKDVASLMVIALGISMLAAPIKVLGSMDLADLAKGLIGLAASLLIVQKMTKVLSKDTEGMTKTATGLIKIGGSLIVFGVGLTALAIPFKMMSSLNFEQIISGSVGMGAAILSLYVVAKAVANLHELKAKELAKLALLAAIVAMISVIIDVMAVFTSADTAVNAATSLSAVLLSVSAAMIVLAAIPMEAALAGLRTLLTVVVGVSAIVAAMGAIAQIPGAKWLVDEGKQFLQSVGEAIGAFFGGIAGGAITAVSQSLPGLGEQLSLFAKNAAPFFDTMKGVDPSICTGVANLAMAMTLLTGANIADAATAWLTGGTTMADFGQDLAEFGPLFKQFADSVAGIDAGAVEASANAAKALAEMASNIPASGGIAQSILGDNDIITFGDNLISFGTSLKRYSEVVSGIDAEAITASAEAAKGLAEVASAIPATGGIAQVFTGEQNLADFGPQLTAFGTALSQYSSSVAGVNTSAIVESANAAKALVEVANSLEASGGAVEFFTGKKDFAGFSENVKSLGGGLTEFSNSVSGVNIEAVQRSSEVLKTLVETLSSIDAEGGLAQFFNGSQADGINSFASMLNAIGEGVKNYADQVSGGNFDNVEPASEALKKVAEVVNNLNDVNVDGINNFKESIENLGDMGLANFDEALKTSAENVATSMSSLADAIGNGAGSIGTAIDNLKSKLQNESPFYEDSGRSIGEALDRGIGSGIEASSGDVVSKMKTVCENAVNAAKEVFRSSVSSFTHFGTDIANAVALGLGNLRDRFYQSGRSMADGLRDGINDGRSGVVSAAVNMANEAHLKSNQALGIHSPSTKFIETGRFSAEGFAVGFKKWGKLAVSASENMAMKAYDSAKSVASKITNLTFDPTASSGGFQPVYSVGSGTISSLNASMSSQALQDISRAIDTKKNNQNGSVSTTNNKNTNVYINGARINDDEAMRNATKNYLIELQRLGAM